MVTNIKLQAGGNILTISSQEWSEVVVETPKGKTILGADNKQKILDRLATALENKTIKHCDGKIMEISVAWITSLSEGHSSIYIGDSADGRNIFIQNERGELIADFCLSDEKIREWLNILLRSLINN